MRAPAAPARGASALTAGASSMPQKGRRQDASDNHNQYVCKTGNEGGVEVAAASGVGFIVEHPYAAWRSRGNSGNASERSTGVFSAKVRVGAVDSVTHLPMNNRSRRTEPSAVMPVPRPCFSTNEVVAPVAVRRWEQNAENGKGEGIENEPSTLSWARLQAIRVSGNGAWRVVSGAPTRMRRR